MARSLIDAYSSNRVNAKNKFRPNPVVEVHVENEDDIPFWKRIFQSQSITVKIYPCTKSKKRILRGKENVFKHANSVGKFKLIAVDSDYDDLLGQNSSVYGSPYVFQTYTYSYENYLCNPNEMALMCIAAVLADEVSFNFEIFFSDYSEIIYPLFLYHLVYKALGQETVFPMNEFHETISIPKNRSIAQKNKTLSDVRTKVNAKLTQLNRNKPINRIDLIHYETQWNQMGLTKTTCFLFLQGHFVFDTTEELLKQVCFPLQKKKENEFTSIIPKRGTKEEKEQKAKEAKMKIAEYQSQIKSLNLVLGLNTNYTTTALWDKIIVDIQNYKTIP